MHTHQKFLSLEVWLLCTVRYSKLETQSDTAGVYFKNKLVFL